MPRRPLSPVGPSVLNEMRLLDVVQDYPETATILRGAEIDPSVWGDVTVGSMTDSEVLVREISSRIAWRGGAARPLA